MYLLAFYVTEDYLQEVKSAVFAAGGGRIGNYEACSWETAGVGQFRPCEGSSPFLGKHGVVETVKEMKVEMVVDKSVIKDCVKALKSTHPFETPAYHVLKLEPF